MTKITAASVVSLFLLVVLSFVGRHAGAADKEAQVKQVTALDDAATAAYSEGDFDKMKKQLLKALSIGKDSLASDPIMARVYLHLGVLYVDGLDNRAVGVKYFGKALKIRPDIEVRSNMATKTVMAAFTEAGQQQEAAPAAEEAPPPARASRRETAAERDEEAEALRPPRAAASEKCRGSDADVAAMKKEARNELDRLDKALTMSKDALAKERAEADKYRTAKMDLERQLSEAKMRVKELENQVAIKEKQGTAVEQREKKERDAREALLRVLPDDEAAAMSVPDLEAATGSKSGTLHAMAAAMMEEGSLTRSGKGVKGSIEGKTIVLGNFRMLQDDGIPEGDLAGPAERLRGVERGRGHVQRRPMKVPVPISTRPIAPAIIPCFMCTRATLSSCPGKKPGN